MNKYGNPTIKVKMVKKSLKNEWPNKYSENKKFRSDIIWIW